MVFPDGRNITETHHSFVRATKHYGKNSRLATGPMPGAYARRIIERQEGSPILRIFMVSSSRITTRSTAILGFGSEVAGQKYIPEMAKSGDGTALVFGSTTKKASGVLTGKP